MSGKVYSGEKAVISLTSWKKRIDTVGLTLFSLLKQCPGFHVVLVLSEEEFPTKEAELPASLMAFVNAKKIEILWVYRNYKSYKKVLFTMDKYKDVPVISADDDSLYICNYAESLYETWNQHKNSVVKWTRTPDSVVWAVDGHATLYTYDVFGKYAFPYLKLFDDETIYLSKDDDFYNQIIQRYNIAYIGAGLSNIYITHHDNDSLTKQSVTTLQQNIEYFNTKFKTWGVL